MPSHAVSATQLNLRSSPAVATGNLIASMPHGTEVDVIDQSLATWWKVSATIGVRKLVGFCSSKYLAPLSSTPPPTTHTTVTPVHMPEHPSARRQSAMFRHCPLGEKSVPRRNSTDPKTDKIASLHALVDFLNVEQSARYLRTPHSTFCNIYAYDFGYFAGGYVPRVWWNSKALVRLSAGQSVTPVYAKTVFEMNANALYDWFHEWGDDFGWTEAATATEAQDAVNEGQVGIVSAKRRDVSRSGHITCILPETGTRVANRQGGVVIAPLQSQAGSTNKKYFQNDWWTSSEYSGFGFWFHD